MSLHVQLAAIVGAVNTIEAPRTGTGTIKVTMKGKTGNRDKKFQHLEKNLLNMESVLVAYSGGVDSSLVLRVAKDVLGSASPLLDLEKLFSRFHSDQLLK